ncbi:MAG TPA: phosphoglycerate dehydrogenase [Casimicrobiaceae bacterium]|nr:phosphoglycerate dehydrogenase [Casimicrobiaceae bacterium]
MTYRIRTLNRISARALERLPPGRYESSASLDDADAIIVRSADLHSLVLPPTVKAIGRAGVGTNNIPVDEMSARGIPVFNAPGGNANAVCELVLGMIVMAARNVVPALSFVAELEGDDLESRIESSKSRFAGVEIASRTLGVIGLGAIGGLVAEGAAKLGMRVLGFDPYLKSDAAHRIPACVHRVGTLEELLGASQFVTLHVPLAPATRHLIDSRALSHLPHDAVLLNFARDAIVDRDAVRDAVRGGRLRSYVCDFPDASFAREPRIVALPHLGASTAQAEENCALMVVDEVRDYLEHGTIRNAVNFPDVEMARESSYRVGIANANVPNMLGQISSTMARAGLNIHNMVNKSRGEMAYTLVDVDSEVDGTVIQAIAAIKGVLSVRLIPDLGD